MNLWLYSENEVIVLFLWCSDEGGLDDFGKCIGSIRRKRLCFNRKWTAAWHWSRPSNKSKPTVVLLFFGLCHDCHLALVHRKHHRLISRYSTAKLLQLASAEMRFKFESERAFFFSRELSAALNRKPEEHSAALNRKLEGAASTRYMVCEWAYFVLHWFGHFCSGRRRP